MTPKTVIFQPARHPRWQGVLKPVSAQQSGYGLVIHPTIMSGPHCKFGYWDVSDPETGCLIAYGEFPGREGAVAALVHAAIRYGKRPGGFRRALEVGREKTRRQIASEKPYSPIRKPKGGSASGGVIAGTDRTTSGAIGQP